MRLRILVLCLAVLAIMGCATKDTGIVDYKAGGVGTVIEVPSKDGDVSMYTYPPKMEGLSKYYADQATLEYSLDELVGKGAPNVAAYVARYAPEEYDAFLRGWIKSRLADLPPPFFYVLAEKTASTDADEAVAWVMRGWGAAAVDAMMCRDKSAGQGIRYLPYLLSDETRGLVNGDEAVLKQAQLDSEVFLTTLEQNYTPMWICSHGISSFGGQGNEGHESLDKRSEKLKEYFQRVKE